MRSMAIKCPSVDYQLVGAKKACVRDVMAPNLFPYEPTLRQLNPQPYQYTLAFVFDCGLLSIRDRQSLAYMYMDSGSAH